MTITIILLFGSAFFTDVIGVHAIFGKHSFRTGPYLLDHECALTSSLGAFLAGLVVPREGGLAITLTEKLEDMVAIIFLPLVSTLFSRTRTQFVERLGR